MTDKLWVVLLGEVKERGVRGATVVSLRDGPRQVFGPFDGHTDAAAFARQHGGITWNVRPPGSMQKWRESEADAHAGLERRFTADALAALERAETHRGRKP